MDPEQINQLARDRWLQASVDRIKLQLGMKPQRNMTQDRVIEHACAFFRISPVGAPESIVNQLLWILQRCPPGYVPPPPPPKPGILSPPGHNVSPTSVLGTAGYSPSSSSSRIRRQVILSRSRHFRLRTTRSFRHFRCRLRRCGFHLIILVRAVRLARRPRLCRQRVRSSDWLEQFIRLGSRLVAHGRCRSGLPPPCSVRLNRRATIAISATLCSNA